MDLSTTTSGLVEDGFQSLWRFPASPLEEDEDPDEDPDFECEPIFSVSDIDPESGRKFGPSIVAEEIPTQSCFSGRRCLEQYVREQWLH